MVPLANTLKPNCFEAECLTGLEVKSEAQALEAAAALHDMGPQTVVSFCFVNGNLVSAE
jgi:pyridoxal/pyridoxine/pyridoxamine kinase